MSSPFYCIIKGSFIPKNYEPDGDSVRFIADNPDLYQNLHGSYRIKPSRKDGSVQLRFEAVDAPEIHYGKASQRFGDKARDQLLAWMGFKNIQYFPNNPDRVQSSEPETVRGAILSKAAEANGRPISYILLENDAASLKDGDWVRVDDALLKSTINYRLLDEGIAYYTVYTSTPFDHRQLLRKVASQARDANRGVWELDTTTEFVLVSTRNETTYATYYSLGLRLATLILKIKVYSRKYAEVVLWRVLSQDSIGPDGQLILPKLFRRCTDYLKDVDNGFQGNLADWLIWISGGSRNENDRVIIHDYLEVWLSDLIDQRNKRIVFKADMLDIMFMEK